MLCENCKYYMEKPFVRECDKHNYCSRTMQKIENIDTDLCDYFEQPDKY